MAKRNRTEPYVDLEREEAMNLLKEAFTVATEVIDFYTHIIIVERERYR